MESPILCAADTMNFWIEGKRSELLQTLREVDMLVINDAEARMLAEESSLPKAARKIRDLGPRSVIVKRGEYGVALFGEEDTFAAPAFPLEDVLDPTGAGDSFAGALMGYLSSPEAADKSSFESLRTAVAYGTVVASFAVADFSLKGLTSITKSDIDNRFETLRKITQF